jgi:hypothetical protein
MNPRSIGNFLKSKFGLFLVFVAVLFSGLWIYGRQQAEERAAERLAAQSARKVELGQVRVPLNQGLESGIPQPAGDPAPAQPEEWGAPGAIVPFRPVAAKPATAPVPPSVPAPPPPEPKPRKVRFAPLLASYAPPQPRPKAVVAPPPEKFMPFGTLLKCKLVNTLDSANMETPVIAVLLEDIWQNGRKVIPANTLVHGVARSGRLRDRITAAGAWRFVWQDGRELSFNGVALDREYDHEIDGYGITDGSAGLKGRLMATDDLRELKLLAAAALSGFARGTQDRTQTALGTTITGSVSNGVREGFGEVFTLYAQRTLKDIEDHGYFVRVPAGKEFYVYVLESVDPQKASVADAKSPPKAEAESNPSLRPSPNQG